ncbi:MAG TPA: hypothetical protein VI504_08555 [Candidatus Eisenbacteria bacterium]
MRSRIFRARGRLSCMRAAAFSLIFLAATAHAAWTPVIGTRVAAAPPIAHLTPIEDGAGGAFLLTFDEIPYPGDAPHVFAHHVLSTGDLASNWPAGGAPVCSTSVVDVGCYNARLKELSACPDGSGGLYVGWAGLPRLAGSIGWTARVVHLDPTGSLVAGWPSAGLAVSDGAGQSALALHPDGTGGVLVAWRDDRSLTSEDIAPHLLLQHFLADGTRAPGFAERGRLLSPELSGYLWRGNVAFTPDPGGGAWALFSTVSTDTSIARSRFRVSRWDASGLETISAVELPGTSQDLAGPYPATATLWPDAQGGAWVVVASYARGGCFATHVLANGARDPALPVHGLPLAADANARPEPDGNGGFLVKDFSGYEVMALRHLLANGTPDPAWSTAVPIAGSRDARLYRTSDGVLAAGWSLPISIQCSPYVGIAVVGRVLADGTAPAGWPAQGIANPSIPTGVDASSESREYPMASCSDGQGGLIAFWTVGEAFSPDVQPGDVRAMRFSTQGPVASVTPGSGSGAISLRGARFGRGGIHVTADGFASAGATLSLYDLFGRRVSGLDLPASATALDVVMPGSDALRPGIYFLRLRSRPGEARARVLVVK